MMADSQKLAGFDFARDEQVMLTNKGSGKFST